jgi:hypothetical protein
MKGARCNVDQVLVLHNCEHEQEEVYGGAEKEAYGFIGAIMEPTSDAIQCCCVLCRVRIRSLSLCPKATRPLHPRIPTMVADRGPHNT